MRIRKEYLVIVVAGLSLAAKALSSSEVISLFRNPSNASPSGFHTEKELKEFYKTQSVFRITDDDDPILPGEYFLHSESCRGCHGPDSLNYGNVDYSGTTVNVFDDWQATMMANSARDPFWRAKVSHEILVNPSHALELQTKCTSCHAPMGHYTAMFQGQSYYTLNDLYNDSLGLDGVSCTGCHTIGPDFLGSVFSGNIPYDTNHIIYGPYPNPVQGPMQLYVGYTPVLGPHMDNANVCSPCHTLITESADLNGNPTGRTFVEQATYHEWVNSVFSADFVSCQRCHMPQISDSIVIANGYLNLPPRAPFNKHEFSGANMFMMKLMNQFRTQLGVPATPAQFDSTLASAERLLKNQTLNLTLLLDSITLDTAFIKVRLVNKAGHKFPSGYPSRRAVLQFALVGANQDTVFQSGFFDSQFEVIGVNSTFEPHYQVISQAGEVQIYEMVAGDVNANKTTVLERMDTLLKDNRIPPEGFLMSSSVYDTVRIAGDALSDPDFNFTLTGDEGSGMDYVYFHIPVTGLGGNYAAYARMYYQAVPPAYLQEMFSYSSPEIDTFQSLYNQADQQPVCVAKDSILQLNLTVTKPDWEALIQVFPDPTADGFVQWKIPENAFLEYVKVVNMQGQVVVYETSPGLGVQLPEVSGTYFLELSLDGNRILKKIIRN